MSHTAQYSVQIVSSALFICLFYQQWYNNNKIYICNNNKSTFAASSFSSSGRSHTGSFALHQWRAEKCRLMTYLHFATHACFVYDVTDTDRWAQNGSTHGRAFAAFERRFAANRSRNRVKNKQTKTGPMMLFPSCSPLSTMLCLFWLSQSWWLIMLWH